MWTRISAEQLQEKLFSCGFEVEELTYLAKTSRTSSGRSLHRKAPRCGQAHRLQVDCGEHGASRSHGGDQRLRGGKVPSRSTGPPSCMRAACRKSRRQAARRLSEGMMCSGEELGITDDFTRAPRSTASSSSMKRALGADIRPSSASTIISSISPSPPTAPTASASSASRAKSPPSSKTFQNARPYYTAADDVKIAVEVKEPALCPRYVGNYVADVKVGTSPRWLRRRLALCGLRSVSDIVDITNFVLLELGQPMHAFDRNYLEGDAVIVRRAAQGEKIVTLDEKQFTLTPDNLLICDRKKGVALAGIMGGLNSEIKADTGGVLRGGKFARDSVSRPPARWGSADSSARFEKGMDAWTCALPWTRAAPGAGARLRRAHRLPRGRQRRGSRLGHRAEYEKIDAVLGSGAARGHGCHPRPSRLRRDAKGGGMSVTVPLWREDVDGYPTLPRRSSAPTATSTSRPPSWRAPPSRTVVFRGAEDAGKVQAHPAARGLYGGVHLLLLLAQGLRFLRLPAEAPERAPSASSIPSARICPSCAPFLRPACSPTSCATCAAATTRADCSSLPTSTLPGSFP